MQSFSEYLNDKPSKLKDSWHVVEHSWMEFLHELHDYMSANMSRYDAHHSKFGDLMGEHPDQQMKSLVKSVETQFKNLKIALAQLGAHEMVG